MRAVARSGKIGKILFSRALWPQSRRTYLSAEYSCEKEWELSRKNDLLLQNIETEAKFIDVLRKINNKASSNIALDVDIFVNTLQSADLIEELGTTLNRFRRSKHTIGVLPSTPCAVVRYCLKNGHEDKLIDFFDDRLNFGVFPDTQTLNFALNVFLEKQKYRHSAKIAVHLMLQEDLGNDITKVLALIACERYLSAGQNAAPWKVEPPKTTDVDDDDEIEYVRVPHLTNPWFDDHFDLTDPNDLIGKTLVFFGRASQGIVRDSAVLIGLARHRKWDELRKALAEVKEVSEDTQKLCLERIVLTSQAAAEADGEQGALEGSEETSPEETEKSSTAEEPPAVNTIPDWLQGELSKLKTSKATLFELLEKDAKNLGDTQKVDIKIQKDAFQEWVKRRRSEQAAQDWSVERSQRFQVLKQRKIDLIQKEELLYFFENWKKIEMVLKEVEIEQSKLKEKEKEYRPPDVNARRRGELPKAAK